MPTRRRPKASGAPGWMVTFADLMALMLTFFVLLLSMSVIDIQRFQAALMSLQGSFGKPWHSDQGAAGFIIGEMRSPPTPLPLEDLPPPQVIVDEPEPAPPPDLTEPLFQALSQALQDEIDAGYLEVERSDLQVLVRFQQHISFPLASADLQASFLPILDKVASALKGVDGSIVVVGHTDDLPIRTVRFRSNWDLSSARAASVVHYLLENSQLAHERVIAAGRADTQPLVPNTSMANRDKNRRVEVVIRPEVLPGQDVLFNEQLLRPTPSPED